MFKKGCKAVNFGLLQRDWRISWAPMCNPKSKERTQEGTEKLYSYPGAAKEIGVNSIL